MKIRERIKKYFIYGIMQFHILFTIIETDFIFCQSGQGCPDPPSKSLHFYGSNSSNFHIQC